MQSPLWALCANPFIGSSFDMAFAVTNLFLSANSKSTGCAKALKEKNINIENNACKRIELFFE
jgi:hypothetical protein